MAEMLYVGTTKGVTTLCRDNGSPWHIEHQGLKDWHVTGVVAVPSEPNRVLAATRGDGVWLSEDFGKSWKKPCYGKLGPGKVQSITLDPAHAGPGVRGRRAHRRVRERRPGAQLGAPGVGARATVRGGD